MLGDIEEFITGHRETESTDLERILATVLFTDIVDSTRRAAKMGDQNWRRLLDSHDQLARQMVERHREALKEAVLSLWNRAGNPGLISFGRLRKQ